MQVGNTFYKYKALMIFRTLSAVYTSCLDNEVDGETDVLDMIQKAIIDLGYTEELSGGDIELVKAIMALQEHSVEHLAPAANNLFLSNPEVNVQGLVFALMFAAAGFNHWAQDQFDLPRKKTTPISKRDFIRTASFAYEAFEIQARDMLGTTH